MSESQSTHTQEIASTGQPQHLRTCVMCKLDLPKTNFYRESYNRDKLRSKCIGCCKKQTKECAQKLAATRSMKDETESLAHFAVNESVQSGTEQDSLYIITNHLIPNIIKIGRAINPSLRAHDLSRSQPFTLAVHKTYPHWGLLETTVHRRLKNQQVTTGRGTEWFTVDQRHAEVIIEATILEFKLNH